jgi:hypothetical protein
MAEVTRPAGVITVIRPVRAPSGTRTTRASSRLSTMVAGTSPNSTEVAVASPAPLMVTRVPGRAIRVG